MTLLMRIGIYTNTRFECTDYWDSPLGNGAWHDEALEPTGGKKKTFNEEIDGTLPCRMAVDKV